MPATGVPIHIETTAKHAILLKRSPASANRSTPGQSCES